MKGTGRREEDQTRENRLPSHRRGEERGDASSSSSDSKKEGNEPKEKEKKGARLFRHFFQGRRKKGTAYAPPVLSGEKKRKTEEEASRNAGHLSIPWEKKWEDRSALRSSTSWEKGEEEGVESSDSSLLEERSLITTIPNGRRGKEEIESGKKEISILLN